MKKPQPDADEAGGWYFNGIGTMRAKTRFAQTRKLRGVMLWELGQDSADETSLLRAVRQAADSREPVR